jgi:polyhydroxyalkanoate synthesis regulator phasin
VLALAGCNKSVSPELARQQQEEQRLKDQQERAALAEKMKAAALAREQKQEPIKALQKKIDALDAQISDARSKGKDWRPLAKVQEALDAEKYELERQ